ncbi:MAG: hypothetical protein H0X34_07120 [Chthoniobacterales bacterium]|nr:hypothetical protein [Chthoniobacterales bacterium]
MTMGHSGASEFFVRLRMIENANLKPRDIVVLYAVRATPGMMGLELAKKLGYRSRSNVQDCVIRLVKHGYAVDRRVADTQQTPNDLHCTPAGELLLSDIVPK